MAISNLLTGRVRVVSPKNVTLDRYQFLDLSQAEPNLGVPNFSASLSGSPAIVVSDDQGNRGFVRSLDLDRVTGQFTGSFTGSATSLSGSFTGSFSGSFIGDGSQLRNLPDSTFIASGSATASFKEGNLLVNTNTRIQGDLYVDDTIYAESIIVSYISSSVIYSSGSNVFGDNYTDTQQFTGSVLISSSLNVSEVTGSSFSGSFTGSFFGDGRNLFNLPEATKLATGSITASVSPQFGFKVESIGTGSQFTGSVDISGSLFINPYSGSIKLATGSVYYGEGKYLREIPRSALTEDALISTEIKSGSVTASVAPNFGFKVESVASGSRITGSVFITGSMIITAASGALILGSSSAYFGEGTYLRNIPRNALTEDALISTEIKSGSVTASVSPNFGFVVTSPASGSKFTGSLFVTGGIVQLAVGSFYSGSGQGLFNIPLSALAEEVVAATRIQTGSVTASVSPERGFQVISVASGSQFTGSLFVTGSGIELSSGSFSGSGFRLFNIPKTAISDLDTSLIFSGSYTASINPDFGFRVNTRSTVSGSFVVSSSAEPLSTSSIPNYFYVTNIGASSYNFDGAASGQDPILTLVRGVTYRFEVNATGHPFYIKTAGVTGIGSQYTTGVLNNGTASGSVYFTPPSGSPDTLYYICQFHSDMSSSINIVDNLYLQDRILFEGNTAISGGLYVRDYVRAREFTGSFSGSFIQGDGSGLFNIPRSAFTGDAFRIASGSITASVTPEHGFRVQTDRTASAFGSQFTGSVDVSGSVRAFAVSASIVSGSFYGDGSNLRNVPSEVSNRISSGSVTASVNPDGVGFKVESSEFGSRFTGSLFVSGGGIFLETGSSFSGSGRFLYDIPRSALSFDISLIASGSITASVSPTYGLKVESAPSGSRFTGSLFVSGGIYVKSGSHYSGSGRYLFDIPAAAISDLDTSKIFSGSVTASVAPNFGFVVNSVASGSTFSGSLLVSGSTRFRMGVSASVFSGSGAGLTDIPFSALSQELFRIASGSVTASALPDFGFKVDSVDSGSQITGSVRITGSLFVTATSGALVLGSSSAYFGEGTYLRNILH